MADSLSNNNQVLSQEERISDYLRGKMTVLEEEAFLAELNSNVELKEQAVLMARLAKGLKSVGESQDKDTIEAFKVADVDTVKNIARKVTSKGKSSAKTILFERKVVMCLSIAASLTIIFFAGNQYLDYRNTTNLGEEYSLSFNSSSLVRGSENDKVKKELTMLFKNVESGQQLNQSISRLFVLWELSTMAIYNDYTDYSTEIGWNLSIAYLKDNNKEGAKETLRKLIHISENGSIIRNKSQELLNKITDK